jgi:hypothetical protein
VHMKYPCNTGEEGGKEPLGHPTDLERKRKGENSMLESAPKEAFDLLLRESAASLRRCE